MMHAYNKVLLDKAADSMGRLLDFSVHSLRIGPDAILNLFIASGVSSLFERGDIGIICGMSGIELAYEILERSGMAYARTNPRLTAALSPEYWCGFALASLQWEHAGSFDELISLMPPDDLIEEYKKIRADALNKLPWDADEQARQAALREASSDFMLAASALYEVRSDASRRAAVSGETNLKKMRIKNGLSQSDLAKTSGVPLRTIQQYEQRQKDINHARAEYIVMLSSALNCDPRHILEN